MAHCHYIRRRRAQEKQVSDCLVFAKNEVIHQFIPRFSLGVSCTWPEISYSWLSFVKASHRRRRRRGGGTCPLPLTTPQKSGKKLSGKYVKLGHFVNFSCMYFWVKVNPKVPKLTELLTPMKLVHVDCQQGRRHDFMSGGYKYYCERSEQKIFWVVPPTYAILGVQQLQRQAYGEPIDSVATMSYWSCSCNFSQYLNTLQIPGVVFKYFSI